VDSATVTNLTPLFSLAFATLLTITLSWTYWPQYLISLTLCRWMAILQVAAWLMTTPYSWTPNIIWEVAPRTLSALLFSVSQLEARDISFVCAGAMGQIHLLTILWSSIYIIWFSSSSLFICAFLFVCVRRDGSTRLLTLLPVVVNIPHSAIAIICSLLGPFSRRTLIFFFYITR